MRAVGRRLRGVLELMASGMCVYTMFVSTPLGGLAQDGLRRAMGRPPAARTLVSYFSTEGEAGSKPAIAQVAQAIQKSVNEPMPLQPSALRPALARALVAMAAEFRMAPDGELDVHLPAGAATSFSRVGVALPAASAAPVERKTALLAGVGALAGRLHSEEAAVASAVVDVGAIEQAIAEAGAVGSSSASEYRSFRPFLAPGDRRAIDPFLNGVFALATGYELAEPLRVAPRVTSTFGVRVHPVLKTEKMHTGIDLAVPIGTEIQSAARGRILYATEDAVNGKFVKIDHGHGLTTAYCHASELRVERGESVLASQLLALSGSTGRSTGPHLHFQVEIDGQPIDPALFLPALLNPPLTAR